MNEPMPARGTWGRVEFYTSFFLLIVLASVIGTRLGFESVWQLPTLDLGLSVVALALVLASFWFARHSRRWRLAIIAFASATQLVPMVVRQPVLLFPLLGALIPVAILGGCLVALSKKGGNGSSQKGS
ncbi:LrgA [Rhodanobacter sp. FW510-R12]|uniref:LrgA n=1 Tax=unclassified Rhodanobacter TaxID=2621553 RepID=UPI0007AA278D|nr:MULTISPECIES: LrgA [unclassified Rhodanobacter]KZC15355.1 LrgA [Rhodanobacter sp. FW104-R8]KZC25879.1 LrgA [Rhodanobacter sp. FW510-T8]KZC33748.1 LrgA [Rhodanobacter sp. FW510-R10]